MQISHLRLSTIFLFPLFSFKELFPGDFLNKDDLLTYERNFIFFVDINKKEESTTLKTFFKD